MQRFHIDYADIEGHQVLVIIDVHSKWIEAIPMHSATADITVNALRKFFSSFGLPEEIVGDNGTQFKLTNFKHFVNGMESNIQRPHRITQHPMGRL